MLLLQLLPLQPLQAFELHVQNGLSLHVGQAEALHQPLLGLVIAGADDVDDLVDVVPGNEQPLQQVGALPGLVQVVTGTPDDDLLLKGDVFVQNLTQSKDARLGLVVHQSQHDHGKGGL
ncbi:hypothetical protein SDC9_207613 [bioreactor metagenome]|uniref:Uncharacterized protein n=1 Tax=bioreactor metagenome TaxID=1076179 RepID=A0A645J8D8_9ZZZZ